MFSLYCGLRASAVKQQWRTDQREQAAVEVFAVVVANKQTAPSAAQQWRQQEADYNHVVASMDKKHMQADCRCSRQSRT